MEDKDLLRGLSAENINALRGALGRRGGVKTRGGRLPPISPRALSLGSTKKSFSPSIPQRRIQVKEEPNTSRGTSVSTEKRRDRSQRGRGGRGRGRANYIQTAGALFGEGISNVADKKRSVESTYTKIDVTPVKPVYTPLKPKTEQEMEEEKQMFEEEEELEHNSDDEPEDERYKLVQLPLRLAQLRNEAEKEPNAFLAAGLKTEVKSSPEPFDAEKSSSMTPENVVKLEVEPSTDVKVKKEVEDVEEEFKDEVKDEVKAEVKDVKPGFFENHELLLIQMPSFLPFKSAASVSSESDSCQKETPLSSEEDESREECKSESPFSEVPEGVIGKIQVLRSGVTKLVLGSMKYVLKSEEDAPFLQQLVCIDEEKSAVSVLAHVSKMFTCIPEVSQMLPVEKQDA